MKYLDSFLEKNIYKKYTQKEHIENIKDILVSLEDEKFFIGVYPSSGNRTFSVSIMPSYETYLLYLDSRQQLEFIQRYRPGSQEQNRWGVDPTTMILSYMKIIGKYSKFQRYFERKMLICKKRLYRFGYMEYKDSLNEYDLSYSLSVTYGSKKFRSID